MHDPDDDYREPIPPGPIAPKKPETLGACVRIMNAGLGGIFVADLAATSGMFLTNFRTGLGVQEYALGMSACTGIFFAYGAAGIRPHLRICHSSHHVVRINIDLKLHLRWRPSRTDHFPQHIMQYAGTPGLKLEMMPVELVEFINRRFCGT